MQPGSWKRSLLAAEGYWELGLYDHAAREIAQIPEAERDRVEVQGFQVMLETARECWPEAATLASHLVTRQPENPQWWISYAYATRRAASILHAEAILRQALVLHPEEALVIYNLSCYAAQTGRLEEARSLLHRALELQPNFRDMAREDPDLKPLGAELVD